MSCCLMPLQEEKKNTDVAGSSGAASQMGGVSLGFTQQPPGFNGAF